MPGKHNMPTVEQWKSLTKPFQRGTRSPKHLLSGRGTNMKVIDQALALYWMMYQQYGGLAGATASDGRILAGLRAITTACDNWLQVKAAAGQDGLTGMRRTAVTNLRRMSDAQQHMQESKNRSQAVPLPSHGLAGGYTKEFASRTAANASHTQRTASSASSVVAAHGDVHSPAPLSQAQQNVLGNTLQILQQHDLSTMSQGQFEQVAAHLGQIQGQENFNEPAEVVFLKRAGRVDYTVIPRNGQLEDASGMPFDTGVSNGINRMVMYAMDQYGTLLVRPAYGRMNGLNFNHSSLVGGKPVMCAGEIAIIGGALKYINNNSGHYQPTAAQLAQALVWLYHENIDISTTKVDNTAPNAAHAGPWKGSTFAGNQAAAANWTANDDLVNGFV